MKFDFLIKQGFELNEFYSRWDRHKDGFQISHILVITIHNSGWKCVKNDIKKYRPNGMYKMINKKCVRIND